MVQSRKSELVTTGATAAAKVAIYEWARELVTWLEKGRAAANGTTGGRYPTAHDLPIPQGASRITPARTSGWSRPTFSSSVRQPGSSRT